MPNIESQSNSIVQTGINTATYAAATAGTAAGKAGGNAYLSQGGGAGRDQGYTPSFGSNTSTFATEPSPLSRGANLIQASIASVKAGTRAGVQSLTKTGIPTQPNSQNDDGVSDDDEK